ncbi:MAG: ABC transporter ATP-binding protein/permease [Roseiflexus sp.]|nr:ABC transporter ATP-binding protein/permease [Roseiflexus sp.]MCS7289588.1 ABC transporter ATP-binding protein/permease [Roseiflexus sp.]MDW8231729.1 ABC transporter ATP-binding protein [Roseiflexaceae bacterium]
MTPLRRSLIFLKPYLGLTIGAVVSLALAAGANLITPHVLRLLIDQGIAARNPGALAWLAAALVGVAVVRGVFSFASGFWSEKASQAVAYDLRNALFAKIQGLSFSYHDRAQTGQLMTRITSDVEQVRTFIGMGLPQLLNALALIIGCIGAMLLMNWQLALLALLTVPLMAGVIGFFMKVLRPLFDQVQQRLGELNTALQENLVGVRVVQAFAREPYEWQRYNRLNQRLLDVNVQSVRAMSLAFPLVFFIGNLGTLAVIWFGGYRVIDGALTIGDLVAFNTYLALLITPLMMLGMIMAQLTRAAVSAERIFEVLDVESEVRDRPGARPLPPVKGRVAFEHVWFGYGVRADGPPAPDGHHPIREDKYILKDVSFVAEPGQTVAILGKTGAGKSTIINLIPRFYDVTHGRVTIDGIDVRDVTLESLRAQIGIVLQDTTLFSGSVRDNIAYGRPDASDAEVEAAARAAQAHEFIVALPNGYNTIIGERGIGLSGGQKQRIAIARALLRDPRILILDDSTSSVDAETEYQIQLALERLMEGRTSFVIAQRISTVRRADLILLLDNGRIVAQGTHEELLASSALYGEIIDSQFGGVREAAEMVEVEG